MKVLVLQLRGRVPALKNDKQLIVDKSGNPRLVVSRSVAAYFRTVEPIIKSQVARQGWETVLSPNPVAVATDVYYYAPNYPKVIPRVDLDNSYTTLQELLQNSTRPNGIAAAIEDDKQVTWQYAEKHYVKSRLLEGATIYVVAFPPEGPDPSYLFFSFLKDRHTYLPSHTNSGLSDLFTLGGENDSSD